MTDIGKTSVEDVFIGAALTSLSTISGVTKLKDDIKVNEKDGTMAKLDLTEDDEFPVIPTAQHQTSV